MKEGSVPWSSLETVIEYLEITLINLNSKSLNLLKENALIHLSQVNTMSNLVYSNKSNQNLLIINPVKSID